MNQIDNGGTTNAPTLADLQAMATSWMIRLRMTSDTSASITMEREEVEAAVQAVAMLTERRQDNG
jgi:hypothetical protein